MLKYRLQARLTLSNSYQSKNAVQVLDPLDEVVLKAEEPQAGLIRQNWDGL